MTKPVTIPNTFATQSGNVPASQLDNNYTALSAAVNDAATYGNYYADSGAANGLIVTISAPLTFAYTSGVWLDVLVNATTTSGAVTINVNGLGTVSIKDASGATMVGGALIAGNVYRLVYDGTNFRAQDIGPYGPMSLASVNVTGSTIPANGIYLPSANTLGLSSAGAQRATVSSTGNWTVNAPSSGTSVVINGLSGSAPLALASTGATAQMIAGWSDGIYSNTWNLISQNTDPLGIGTAGNATFSIATNASTRLTVNGAGNVAINAPSSGTALSVSGVNAQAIAFFTSGNSSTQGSADVTIGRAGSTANNVAQGPSINLNDTTNVTNTILQNSGGQTELWQYNGGWNQILRVTTGLAIQGRGPTNGMTDMTPDKGTFTGSMTGFTAAVSPSCSWVRQGNIVVLHIGTSGGSGTSNANTFTMTGLPAAIQTSSVATRVAMDGQLVSDNGSFVGTVSAVEALITGGSGTVTFLKGGLSTGWTAANTKGFTVSSIVLCYALI